MSESTIYKFITVSSSGQTKEWNSVREAFDNKNRSDDVYVVVIETNSRYKVLRP